MSRLLKHYGSCKTAFFCCDIQEKFMGRVANSANCVFVANRFAGLHTALGTAHSVYVVTEQYPKGLGATSADIRLPPDAHVFSKKRFAMLVPEVMPLVDLPEVEQVVLWGFETHVCVLQTAAALLDMKKKVVIAVDGCGSQSQGDHCTAIQLMQSWSGDGCYVSTSESILMQLLKDASDPVFKTVAPLMKQTHPIRI
ncbi:putative ribonuclease mar1 [Trypanosoma cruzi]|uniref:Ribonuclease mar1, putative n=2 Tax=Trypanosoma cruzi TaxID=5693 RepID=Q4D3U8_TRYCC|nr:ribonuclease mar1, putative [Trypanosoma cruzi]EAN87195.1 ribonuclease mar1, putative [Trypanosoma cruzi]PWV05974.1 putative ribonuclease mar1 [Trypanosoma cruzi]|eukprot:XP_809046.1 ribonuclease mar1 [Trypanosoma cruzi strain CL Brener]